MNCAFIASYYGPYYSNFIASMLEFKKIMEENGHNIVFIFPKEAETFDWIDIFQKKNSNIYFLNYAPYSFQNFKTLKKILKEQKIDIIYSHMCGWDFTVRFAAPFKPVIWHMHMNVNVEDKIKRIKNWLKFNILGFGKTYHIAVSKSVTEAINCLNPRHKCITIPNALDFTRLKVSIPPNNKCKKILVFGYEPFIKGLDITLDACEKLILEGQKFKLLISSQEKTYKYINERYKLLPEWIELLEPTSDISSIYNSVDIMVSASRSEGFSYALAESIYFGLITVVSNIPGTKWSESFSGRFEFESENSESLKSALKKALNHTITIDEKNTNKNILEKEYSINTWSKSVYDELCAIYKKTK